MEIGILIVMIVMFVMGTIASPGWDVVELRNREVWMWTCILIIEALLMPNVYAALLLGTIILGLWQIGRAWYVLRSTIIPVAGIAGIYILLTPHLKLWMVPWVLWTGVGIGMFLTLWAAIAIEIKERPFRLMRPDWLKWFGMWGIYEDAKEPTMRFMLGQANRMHACTLALFAMTCAAGLVWMGQWWAWPFFFMCYLPCHVNWASQGWHRHAHIGHLGLIALGFAALALWNGPVASVLGVTCASALTVYTARSYRQWFKKEWTWFDSGRLVYWTDVVLLAWWPQGWKTRLFGKGTATWFPVTCMVGEKLHGYIFTTAHNEYLQQLVEHGIVGLGILLLYLGEALWRTAHGAPAQQAVFMLGAVWCAIAMVTFPARFFHEYHGAKEKQEVWYGSPPLNLWTLMIALLAEAR